MSEGNRDIAIRLGAATTKFIERFLPAVARGLTRERQTITLGATYKFTLDANGVIEGMVNYHEPKIPAGVQENSPFILTTVPGKGFEFVIDGTMEDLRQQLSEAKTK